MTNRRAAFLGVCRLWRLVIPDATHQLAQALHYDVNTKKTKEARSHYERCLALDPADRVMARRGLVRFLLDAGEADQARVIIDRCFEERHSP